MRCAARVAACGAILLVAPLAACSRPPARLTDFDPDLVPEAYARSTAALMWPGAARAFQVTPEGHLDNGEWRVRIMASSGGVAAPAPRVIAYEDRWRPVAHWRRTSGDIRWDFEAVALPEPAPRDTGVFVSLEVTATNLGAAPRETRLELRMVPLDSTVLFRSLEPPSADSATLDWAADAPRVHVRGLASPPARNGAATWTLPPRGQERARFVLATYATPAEQLAAWARTPHARRADEARQWWTRTLAHGAELSLGDSLTENAVRGALVTLLACRERRGALWVPIGNPFQYRDVWLRDGARAVRALSVAGFTGEAQDLARGLEAFQWPSGAYLSQRGQLDGTGQALWAFEQAHLRPVADTSAGRVAELALDGVKWGERQRSLALDTDSLYGRLLPWGDPRDNELVAAQLVGNDAWLIAGYRSAARLLRAAGRDADADSVDHARSVYVADFERALDATGHPDIPPSWHTIGRDWGNLSASVPCGVLPVSSPRIGALAERLWRAAGGPGLGFYAHPDSLHAYLFADLATWAMLTGRRVEGERMLDSLLAWRSASGGIAELFSRSTRDWGRNAPPHATAAAALVSMVRDALIYDDDDTLRCTLGARERWWRGSHIRRAPTRWGSLELRFERRGDEARWRWTPVPVWSALTLPPGTVLAAPPSGGLRGAAGDTRVLAAPKVREARVRLRSATQR